MESLNFAKGYGKVNHTEDLSHYTPDLRRARRHRIIAISLAVFLTLILASLAVALIHESTTESEDSDSSDQASDSTDPLKTVCAVTRYPDSCFSSISGLNNPPAISPLHFFNLSLHASITEVSGLKNLAARPKAELAMKDCVELLDDAVSQLVRSAQSICVGGGEKVLTEMKISDIQTWISAAMTDQETCLDGLTEMRSTALVDFKMSVQKSSEYMSNTLAILNNEQILAEKLHLTTDQSKITSVGC